MPPNGLFVERTLGGRDRNLRAVLCVAATVFANAAVRQRRLVLAAAVGAAAAGPRFNAVTCFCGLNV